MSVEILLSGTLEVIVRVSLQPLRCELAENISSLIVIASGTMLKNKFFVVDR